MNIKRRHLVLAFLGLWLSGCLIGCTMTIEGDWPGGWSNLDNTTHQNNYKSNNPPR